MPVAANKNLVELLRNHESATPRPIACLEGGSRSGKTWAILEYLINACRCSPGLVVTCFRHDSTTHDDSTIRDFKTIMATKFPRAWGEGGWNGQVKRFAFANGSNLEFDGTNNPQKLHGAPRDVAWLNECMEISLDAWNQISTRTRHLSIFDWNPSFSQHWVFDKVLKREDVLHVVTTYRDNPHLTPQQIAEIEKFDPSKAHNVQSGTADKYMWEVYGLGQRGRREGVIFDNWSVTDEWPDRMNCLRWGLGADFGFSLDPSAVIECALFQSDLYLRQRVYERGLVVKPTEGRPGIPSLVGRLDEAKVPRSARIYCDSAQPGMIQDMVLSGYSAIPCIKGQGSVLAGINLLRSYRIFIHRTSIDLQREFEQYSWVKCRQSGELTDEPEDRNNHGIDAVRYWAGREIAGLRTTVQDLQNKANACARKPYRPI